jgi:GT2 family glycosyltransferase
VPDRDSLAIIIVTYNSAQEIDACLESLVGHTSPFPTTITVVDNASPDRTAAHVRQKWPAVQVIDAGGNLGFAKANNIGIRATSSDYVLLMNPDTVAPPGSIQTLVRGLASHPDAAIAGARLLSDRGFPGVVSGACRCTPMERIETMVFSRLYLRSGASSQDGRVEPGGARSRHWVSGACMVIRRPDLEAVGLLDERYFMYNEDVDLCLAMHKRGRKVFYIAGAEVLHYRGKSAARNPEMERLRQRSHVAYYEKHLPMWTPLLRLYLKVTGKG